MFVTHAYIGYIMVVKTNVYSFSFPHIGLTTSPHVVTYLESHVSTVVAMNKKIESKTR